MAQTDNKSDIQQIGVRMETAAAMIGISVPQFRRVMRSEKHPPFLMVGECVIIPVDAYKEWLNVLAKEGERI